MTARLPAFALVAIAALAGTALALAADAWPFRAIYVGGGLEVVHDDARGVTCWRTPPGGISCLPDRVTTAAYDGGEKR